MTLSTPQSVTLSARRVYEMVMPSVNSNAPLVRELQYACDSEYRCKQFVNCLSEYYPDSQIEARQLWSKYHGTANAVQCDMINHKQLRVWVRSSADCWCGIYYICYYAAKYLSLIHI